MLDRIKLKGPLGMSLAALAICAAALLVQVPSLFSAMFSRGVGENRTLAALDEHVQQHDELATLSQNRFDGRYLFFPPAPPKPKPRPVIEEQPKVEETKPQEPVKPPPPSTYGGPKIAYVIGDDVYFKEGDKLSNLRVGESNDQVKVVGISPPWSVRLLWKETEFDVVPIDWMTREYEFFAAAKPTFTAPAGLVMSASKPDGRSSGASGRGGAKGSDGGGDRNAAIAAAREKQAAARARAAEEQPPPPEEPVEDPMDEETDDEAASEEEADDEAEDDGVPRA